MSKRIPCRIVDLPSSIPVVEVGDAGKGLLVETSTSTKALPVRMSTAPGALRVSGLFTPASLPNLAAWYSADSGVLNSISPDVPATNGQTVRRWLDRSGNNRHLDQSTLSVQPTWTGGRVATNGSTQFMQSTGWTITQPLAIGIATTSNQVASGNMNAIDGVTARVVIRPWQTTGTPNTNLLFAGASLSGNGGGSGYQIITAHVNGASSTIRRNGTATTGNAGSNSLGGLTISATTTGASEFLAQSIAEIVIWQPTIFSTEAASLETYFANRWGAVS